MRKRFVLVPAAVLGAVLSGCGGDTCSSKPADVSGFGSCAGNQLAPNSPVTIAVRLCATCSDTGPNCNTEIVGGQIQVDTTFQECQGNASCAPTPPACSSVNCTVQTPSGGTFTIVGQSGGSTVNGPTVTIAQGGATTCL